MANEYLNQIMPELLSVMKDMASLLEKQDATQEKAKLDKPPKTGEGQKPIVGGTAPGFKPGDKVIGKSFPMQEAAITDGNEATEIDARESTELKQDEEAVPFGGEETPEEEVAESETNDEDAETEESPEEEIKSLLKSIAMELKSMRNSSAFSKADLQKAVRKEADQMLRKMGFTPSKPDVVKLSMGIDQLDEVKKSEDSLVTDVRKSPIGNLAGKDLSKLSWRELGSTREAMGGFNPFIGK